MTMLARAAAFAALLTLAAVLRLEAQVGSVRFTIAGGPHAGSYRFTTGQCDVLGSRGEPPSIISMFTPEMQKDGGAGPNSPTSFELYTEPGRGKPDGLALTAEWRSHGSGKRTVYEVYAIPRELQAVGRKTPLEGRGDVTVRRTETATTASFRGETKRGVRIEGMLECPAKRDD
jgi:hypothetical protein